MALITGSWIMDIIISAATLVLGIYVFYKHQFRYWKKRNVVYMEPSFLVGNLNFSESFPITFKRMYDRFKGHPFFGCWLFFKPTLVICDPELVKHVFVKDFMSFHDRGFYVNEDDPLAAHLFSIGGVKWRYLRTKLTPTFTSGKMKMMFPILQECSEELKDLLKEPARKGEIVEMKEISARFTTDVISLCAFGIQTNSLKNPDAEFRKMGRKLFEPSLVQTLKLVMNVFIPEFAEFIRLTNIPKDVAKFFLSAVKETMNYRERNSQKGNDFLQLLIQLKNVGKLDDPDEGVVTNKNTDKDDQKFTFEQAAAQAFVFFMAGSETSSTTMQFVLYELSLNPEIQEKTREEIQNVLAKHNGKITYESIYEMDYLRCVVDETLRKYPPMSVLVRKCDKEYVIPGSSVVVPAGMQVQIPILGLHMDPEYFPNPEKFDPDRFTETEKMKRHHFTYLPFGEGPRNCIGMRFALMQVRVGLATLLSNYRFEVCSETQIPLVFDPKAAVLAPEKLMKLKITTATKN